MTHFSDNLHLGGAKVSPNADGQGVGPLGRVYVWDTVPAALVADCIAASQTPTSTLTLTAGGTGGVTQVVNGRGETVLQLDVPRAVEVVQAGAGTQRAFTVTGYDYAGQKMSEVITSTVGNTVAGKKAFRQILSITVPGTTTTACTVGTTDVLGCPVRFNDLGYLRPGWNNTLAQDAGTPVVADATDPATTTTGDVRGTYVPSSATDGTKRLVVLVAIPAAGSGVDATRAGAYGVNQNLGTT